MPRSALGNALARSLQLKHGYTEMLSWSDEALAILRAYDELLEVHERIEAAMLEGRAWKALRDRLDALSRVMKELEDKKVSNKSEARAEHSRKIRAARATADELEDDVQALRIAREEARKARVKALTDALETLQKAPYTNVKAITTAKSQATRLGKERDLEGSIEALAALDEPIEDIKQGAAAFKADYKPLSERGLELQKLAFSDLFDEQLADWTASLTAALKAERNGAIGDGLRQLSGVALGLKRLEKTLKAERAARDQYAELVVEVKRERASFLGRSTAHAAYKLGLENKVDREISDAEGQAELGGFSAACSALERAMALMAEWDETANERLKEQLGRERAQRERTERRQREEEQARREKERQQQAESADDTTALLAIGRDRKFSAWLNKLAELFAANKVTLTLGDRRDLDGGTVEFKIAVRGVQQTTFRDDFVVHYHPGASGPGLDHPWASAMHAKPHRGNRSTSRVYMDNTHWLVQLNIAPRRQDVKPSVS